MTTYVGDLLPIRNSRRSGARAAIGSALVASIVVADLEIDRYGWSAWNLSPRSRTLALGAVWGSGVALGWAYRKHIPWRSPPLMLLGLFLCSALASSLLADDWHHSTAAWGGYAGVTLLIVVVVSKDVASTRRFGVYSPGPCSSL